MIPIKQYPFFGTFGNACNDLKINGNYVDQQFLQLKSTIESQFSTSLTTLFFLEQTHSDIVITSTHNDQIKSPLDLRHIEGDAIITNQTNIGIGIATADCLPLFLYDPITKTIAIIHAGWRGVVAQIIKKTIQKMNSNFHVKTKNLIVYLGPAAAVCCYQVQQDFLKNMPPDAHEKNYLETRNNQLFFNNKLMATEQLLQTGVLPKKINTSASLCTICNPGFCSVRLQGAATGRQPSVCWLSNSP